MSSAISRLVPMARILVWHQGSGGAAGHVALCLKYGYKKTYWSFTTNARLMSRCGTKDTRAGYFDVPPEELAVSRKTSFKVQKLQVKMNTPQEDSRRGKPDEIIDLDPDFYDIAKIQEEAEYLKEHVSSTFFQIATANRLAEGLPQNEAQNCMKSVAMIVNEGAGLNLTSQTQDRIGNMQISLGTSFFLQLLKNFKRSTRKSEHVDAVQIFEIDETEE